MPQTFTINFYLKMKTFFHPPAQKITWLFLSLFLSFFFVQSSTAQPQQIVVGTGNLQSFGDPDGLYDKGANYQLAAGASTTNCPCYTRADDEYSIARIGGEWLVFRSATCPANPRSVAFSPIGKATTCDPTEVMGIHAAKSAAPLKLAVYYGWPNGIENHHLTPQGPEETWAQLETRRIDLAAQEWGNYDLAVFGRGVEDVNANADRHNKAQQVIDRMRARGHDTKIYGYIVLGVDNLYEDDGLSRDLSIDEIRAKVQMWYAMGVDGIFFDEAGYDFNVDRSRQNEAINIVHSFTNARTGNRLSVMLNAWDPKHVFNWFTMKYDSERYNREFTFNVQGHRTQLSSDDYYILESFAIQNGNSLTAETDDNFNRRVNTAYRLSNKYGVKVATLTTYREGINYMQAMLDEAWWLTTIYGFDAMGWGEPHFSAGGEMANRLPYRNRPRPSCNLGMDYFPLPNYNDQTGVYSTNTTTGYTITVDVFSFSNSCR